MDKFKEVMKYICIGLFFCGMGFVSIVFVTGAIRFAVAVITNKCPECLDWLGMTVVVLIAGATGLTWYALNEDDE